MESVGKLKLGALWVHLCNMTVEGAYTVGRMAIHIPPPLFFLLLFPLRHQICRWLVDYRG